MLAISTDNEACKLVRERMSDPSPVLFDIDPIVCEICSAQVTMEVGVDKY